VKNILTILLFVLPCLAASATPQFLPLPGTPGYVVPPRTNAPAAQPATPPAVVQTPPAVIPRPPATLVATNGGPATPAASARPMHPLPRRPLAGPGFPGPSGMPGMNPPVSAPVSAPVDNNPVMSAPASLPVLHPHELHFQAAKLESVLTVYTSLVKRNILRAGQLPDASITFDNVTDLTYDEAVEALNSVLGMNGITVIPIGEKFVKVVPTAQANQEGAPLNDITNASDLPDLGGYVTHVVQLKYTKPSDVAQALAPFAKVQGSILPLDSNGILIIRDFTENVKRMLEMIEQIDVAVPSEFISEVIPIKYALATDIASALNSVGGGTTSSVGGTGTSSRTGAAGGTGNRYGANGTTTGLAGTSTGIGANTGAMGLNNNNSALNRTTGNTGANGAAQPTFAQRLQTLINKAGSAGDIQLLGPNKIIPDERTNSLLVFASREDMATIKDIVAKLDVVLAQVLIEAVILDVTLNDNFNFGISAGQAPAGVGNQASVSGGGAINNANNSLANGLAFLNNLIPVFGTNSVGSNVLSGYTASTNLTFPSADGLSYFGKLGPTWNVALSALAGNGNVKVLSRPSIQTSHAVPASIFVGETYPYVTGTYFDSVGGSSQSQYSQTQIGITLNVTPLVNPDGLVVMDISQSVQQIGGTVTIDGNAVPITQDQNTSTKVAVKDGETIVMGGFIQNQKSDTKSGIPYLMDIPLLGKLFRNDSSSGQRQELLILIHPTVLPTPEAAALEPDIQRNRMPAVKAAEADFNAEDAKLLKEANKKAEKAATNSDLNVDDPEPGTKAINQ
jgi:general secretion pathway protein D